MADPCLMTLALDAETQTDRLRDVLAGCVGIERLLALRVSDGIGISDLDRHELSCLLRFMNEGLARQVEAIGDSIRAVLEALRPRLF